MSEIDALLQEHRKFLPSAEFRRGALVSDPALYAKAAEDPEAFWEAQAEQLEWFDKWSTVLDWKPPHAQWFLGGTLNVSVNCVDRHVRTARRNKAALIWEGEPGDRRTLTYWDLYVEVQKFANVLKKLGVKRGDRVAIYMPLIPEVAIAMLACTRIGAHSLGRVRRLLARLTARPDQRRAGESPHHRRRGLSPRHIVPLKRNSDKAIEECPSIEHVVVVQRRAGATGDESFAEMTEGRDHWWHRLMRDASAQCEPPVVAPIGHLGERFVAGGARASLHDDHVLDRRTLLDRLVGVALQWNDRTAAIARVSGG